MKFLKHMMKAKRLKQCIKNLQDMERILKAKDKWEPSIDNCLYMIDLLLPVTDILEPEVFKDININTSYTRTELEEWFSENQRRIKYVENSSWEISKEEIDSYHETQRVSIHDFLLAGDGNQRGQVEFFLQTLYANLERFKSDLTDKNRGAAKVSYYVRTTKPIIVQIASVLEAVAIGVYNSVEAIQKNEHGR